MTRPPGRPRREDASDTRGLIIAAATRAFAERGFDAVTMRDIAAEVGVNVATVHHHAGSKAGLYNAVFARMYQAEDEALQAAADRARARGNVIDGLHELLDAYLGLVDRHPEITFLWLRRWLEPAAHRRLDEDYALPLYELAETILREAGLDEPDPHAATRSVVWAVHGHVTAVAADPSRAKAERAAFHEFAHRLVDALWGDRSR